jgi:translation elongation factor EF-4
MKSIGKVEIPQEALLAILQIDSDWEMWNMFIC